MPVVDLGGAGPIRCGRCRAYINPFFSFLDGGRSFQCNLCGFVNPTPSEYFCEVDQDGYRRDHAERPELCSGGLAPVSRHLNLASRRRAHHPINTPHHSTTASVQSMLPALC